MPRPLLAVSLALAFSGCSLLGGSGGACGEDAASGTLSARVGGEAFSAVCLQGQFESGTLTLRGDLGARAEGRDERVTLTVVGAQPGQTYAFGPASSSLAAYSSPEASAPAGARGVDAVAGSVAVEAVSASGARGTFSFTGANADQQPLAVTEGRFEVTF